MNNIALNKPIAKVSDFHTANPPSQAVDGIMANGNGWNTNSFVFSGYFLVDLESDYLVSSVKVRPFTTASYPTNVRVKDMEIIARKTINDSDIVLASYTFPNQTLTMPTIEINSKNSYRYIGVKILNPFTTVQSTVGIGEFEVYGEIESSYKFLLKQNNQYYTITPEYYSNGQFQPLTLEGGEQPNENDYENFGFYNVNDLLKPIQVGEENFRPYDKLENEFEICMAMDKE